jgi:hypothetical protein
MTYELGGKQVHDIRGTGDKCKRSSDDSQVIALCRAITCTPGSRTVDRRSNRLDPSIRLWEKQCFV